METIADLQKKEVIDIKDGTRFGFVYDVELDITNGRIVSLIVPGNNKMLGLFGKAQDYIISWDKIEKIGEDIILVNN